MLSEAIYAILPILSDTNTLYYTDGKNSSVLYKFDIIFYYCFFTIITIYYTME